MVSRPEADLVAVRDGRQIVRMDALERERDDACAARRRRAVDGQALDLAQRFIGVLGDLQLVRAHRVHPQVAQVVDRGAEADNLANRLGPRLELPGKVVVSGAFDAYGLDYVAA